jgi:hypothetical protein
MFRSTSNIIENPWRQDIPGVVHSFPPPKQPWTNSQEPTIFEINLWEQIYYEPGNIGVYAAWDPYTEFYMITYNLFIDLPFGIKTFYGKDALDSVIKETKSAGINLNITLT